jgi:hypothetical protein
MTVERDETDTDWPAEVDPVSVAITPLIEHIFTVTSAASPERQRALTEVLTAAEKVRAALHRPRLN